MLAAQGGQGDRQHTGQRRLDCAQLQSPAQLAAVAQVRRDAVVDGQDFPRPLHRQMPGFGEHRQSPRAVEQQGIELLLQAAHMQTDGGLGEVNGLRRAGEGAVLGNRDQGP
ncbi:hypothetical protein D3C80_1374870 [compost metagenome]